MRTFTVGRRRELDRLDDHLRNPPSDTGRALLVAANYGAGKSHLIQVIREMALDLGYGVSRVVLNAQEGVRFNRMDTIFGAVCREIKVPGCKGRGVGYLFDEFERADPNALPERLKESYDRLTDSGSWTLSDELGSPAIYAALRAWVLDGTPTRRQLIEDWLGHPENYRGQRQLLYAELIEALGQVPPDPRPAWQLYSEQAFMFHSGGHWQAWNGLAALQALARLSGLRGLVLLFDEFEDVIQGLNRRNHQEEALHNLFRFFSGRRYPGLAYFAVTPDFIAKCKVELSRRGALDFGFDRFEQLEMVELDAINDEDLFELAERVRLVHAIAYDWDAEAGLPDDALRDACLSAWVNPSADRLRLAVQAIVAALDAHLEGGSS